MNRFVMIGISVLACTLVIVSNAAGSAFCPPNGPGAPTYCENIPYLGKPKRPEPPRLPVLKNNGAAQPSATSDLGRLEELDLPEGTPVNPENKGVSGKNPQQMQ